MSDSHELPHPFPSLSNSVDSVFRSPCPMRYYFSSRAHAVGIDGKPVREEEKTLTPVAPYFPSMRVLSMVTSWLEPRKAVIRKSFHTVSEADRLGSKRKQFWSGVPHGLYQSLPGVRFKEERLFVYWVDSAGAGSLELLKRPSSAFSALKAKTFFIYSLQDINQTDF